MADLPQSRLQVDKPPFSHVEVNYFDPFVVTQGRSVVKRYGCIFTCLKVRTVYLEISHSLTTDSFINTLRRRGIPVHIYARRGIPVHIYSDNGTKLVGATRVPRESVREWNQHQISEYLHQQEICWSFNPLTASHMGGSRKRLITRLEEYCQNYWPVNRSLMRRFSQSWPKSNGLSTQDHLYQSLWTPQITNL